MDDDRTGGRLGETATKREWPWAVLGVVCVVVASVAAGLFRSSSGPEFAVLVAVNTVATGLAFLIPQARQIVARRSEATTEEREIDARVETRVAMNDALDPILRLLGTIALETDLLEREKLRAQAVPLVLKTAAEFIGPDRARACWFKLDPGPPRRLDPVEAVGRAGSASTTFEAGTTAGDAAIDLVLADQDLLCDDIDVAPPPGWDTTKGRDYRTFVSVSVIAGDTAYGMLTLDALEPGTLDVEDMALLRLMAGALAVALSVP